MDSQRPLYVHLLTWKAVRSKEFSPIGDESRLERERRRKEADSLCGILEYTTRLPFDALLEHSGSGFQPVRDQGTEETSRRIGRGPWRRLRVIRGGEMRRPWWDRRRRSGHGKCAVVLVEAL